MDHLIRQQLKGEINEKQLRESLRGPAVGTAAALAIIVAARGGAPVLGALYRWATQNPDKVQQLDSALVRRLDHLSAAAAERRRQVAARKSVTWENGTLHKNSLQGPN